MSAENFKPEPPKELRKLSPSRIETINTCSFSYWCSYHLKLPEEKNSGASVGSAVHNITETLLKNRKRHEWKVNKIIEEGTVKAVPCVDRYLKILCAKEEFPYERKIIDKDKSKIFTVEEFVDPLVVTALKCDFYGLEGEEAIAELEHEIDYTDEKNGIRFVIRGFLDRVFLTKDKRGNVKKVRVEDWKSSKSKFDVKKLASNMQAICYPMFILDKYPKVKDVTMRFVFLQFPKNPMLEVAPPDKDIIAGIRHYLSNLYAKINSFTETDAYENFAAYGDGHFLCGGPGKQSITCKKTKRKIETDFPKWSCSYREPFVYHQLSKPCGKIIRTAKKQEDLKLTQTENMSIIAGDLILEKKQYHGCPAFFPQPHQQ